MRTFQELSGSQPSVLEPVVMIELFRTYGEGEGEGEGMCVCVFVCVCVCARARVCVCV